MTATTLHASELDAALQQAIRHAQAGQFADAERLFRGVLQARPDQPGLNNNLGIALQAQGKLNEAVEVFQRAVKVAPDYAPAHSNLGNILFEQGRLPEAEASYRRAIALRPDMADAHKNLGTVMCDLGRYRKAFRRSCATPNWLWQSCQRRTPRADPTGTRRGTTRSSAST